MLIDWVSGANGVIFYACFMSVLIAIAAFFSLKPILGEKRRRDRERPGH